MPIIGFEWNQQDDAVNWVESDFTTIKYLIKSENKIYTLSENKWIETSLVEPLTRENFEEYGTNNLESEVINSLISTFPNPKLLFNSTSSPVVNATLIPYSQLILPKGDIKLKMIESISSLQVTSNIKNQGNIILVFSNDSGKTWKTFDTINQEFEELDISNLTEVKNKGMSIETFNLIGNKWTELLIDGAIRFGYYLELEDETDIASVDKLEITMKTFHRWRKSKKGRDFEYEYTNDKIIMKIYKDGGYKINYM